VNRREFCAGLAVGGAAMAMPKWLLGAEGGPTPEKPNIILIVADDMGWQDAHCCGHPYAKTPNINRLAAEGTRFQQCYATGVVCCPSRTGIMTSWLPARYAKYPAAAGYGERVTITELLHRQGYATGHFGKWHMGPEMKPGTYGIDVIGSEEGETGGKREQEKGTRGRDAHIYDSAINFIEKHKDGPFYVNIWDHVPHHPVRPSPELVKAFGPLEVDESKFPPEMREKFAMCKKRGGDVSEHMRNWLADIKGLDDEIGNLLKRLDDLKLRDNTIVVFTSDQGPESIREADNNVKKNKGANDPKPDETNYLRLNAMGFAGPFRGGKHAESEGGVRIPFIIRWPGHTPAGRVDEKSLVSLGDWLPTLCAVTGVKINAADFDGEDVSDAWLGKAEHVRTKPLLWKGNATAARPVIREGQWKLFGSRRGGEAELYDIIADPGETKNLAAEHPDIVKNLNGKLDAWVATLPKEYIKFTDKDQ